MSPALSSRPGSVDPGQLSQYGSYGREYSPLANYGFSQDMRNGHLDTYASSSYQQGVVNSPLRYSTAAYDYSSEYATQDFGYNNHEDASQSPAPLSNTEEVDMNKATKKGSGWFWSNTTNDDVKHEESNNDRLAMTDDDDFGFGNKALSKPMIAASEDGKDHRVGKSPAISHQRAESESTSAKTTTMNSANEKGVVL